MTSNERIIAKIHSIAMLPRTGYVCVCVCVCVCVTATMISRMGVILNDEALGEVAQIGAQNDAKGEWFDSETHLVSKEGAAGHLSEISKRAGLGGVICDFVSGSVMRDWNSRRVTVMKQ